MWPRSLQSDSSNSGEVPKGKQPSVVVKILTEPARSRGGEQTRGSQQEMAFKIIQAVAFFSAGSSVDMFACTPGGAEA